MAEITMTLGALVGADVALTRLLEVRMSAQLAYRVAKLAKTIHAETTHFTEQRDALIREYGEPSAEDPQKIQVKQADVATFMTRVNELAAVETMVSVHPLALDTLPEMTGADLLALGPLVTGEE